ncbi:MAG TPA: DUF1345 domain-containing protein [Candidatus Tumulicola sp.]|jgi:uncharacterized membrane protein
MSRIIPPVAVSAGAVVVAAAAMTAFAPAWLPGKVRVVAGYDTVAIALLAWFWWEILRTSATQTKARAAAQDPGRDAVTVVILAAVAFGFVAAFDILGRGPHDSAPDHAAAILIIGFAAVVCGWLLIHTIFLFHYAHSYYRNRSLAGDGGLIFPGNGEPGDVDFAYFSFVLGMTFQVSDVQITNSRLRRDALLHGLISFGYNTAILALVVNVVSNLLH